METGQLLAGRYELIKRLGRGGMGEVWAGRDRDLHRDVALKLLVLDGDALPDLPKRFDREAVAAAQVNHPNVVALYDRGIHEDVLFIVMEKVDGITLTERIRQEQQMSARRALAIATDICAALIAAHRSGVIHYDIKPHNVMLTVEQQVKVVDFGIAGFVQAAFSVARSSQLAPAGTPEYGAPEQFLSERGDERSDLYALGGVLFALLTGRAPFTGHSAMAVMRRKLDTNAPRLDTLRPDLPAEVTSLVAELLDRFPERRPGSARLVHERLSRATAVLDTFGAGQSQPTLPARDVQIHEPTAPGPEPAPEAGHRRRLLRKPWPVVAAGALALAVLGGLFGTYRWTQTQYYIGTKDTHVALYRGIDLDLPWISLSEVESDHPEIPLVHLPVYLQRQVRATIEEKGLPEARMKISALAEQAAACKKRATQDADGTPELSDEEELYALQCGAE
ncbi:serine/threonine-protein kinase [Streptomyces sp. NBC_01012]|uniref:serine/threonine-protein kinase n=1 Tax=Streptomyces sp. NBC_01012 TaxID=2903717 RepID=UPI00386BC18E|nr:serine/threonine protein kinase [Streptomyces sp. NBC_01012]